ncbi:MAG: exopolygalacturonase [Prevotella sp.]|nr:exopolygalacturonase [Prevotella sp.]
MKRLFFMTLLLALCLNMSAKQKKQLWPDGTEIDAWFSDTTAVDMSALGKRYVVTDFGVSTDSTTVQTKALQGVIDRCAREGGGVVVIPRGTFLSGSLYFRQGTHLQVEEGGRLKGSDRIEDFDIKQTRIEGETCDYFTALVNADGVDGFVISGPGTIDGNGYHYWKQFWIRREWNRACTNKDEQRPRLVYISNSKNVTVQNVKLINSPFWTNHLYKSDHVRYLGCYIYSSTKGVKGPSTDAIDIDVCHDVLVHGCYMNVNDDAIAMKGGKGTYADKDPNNGPNYNVIIENCHYGVVHGCLTLGSESVKDHNIILRNIVADNVNRVLWLKMRPDTPQHYEYVTVENVTGNTNSFLVVRPWTQFFKPQERADMPLSQCNNIVMKDINMECRNFFDVGASDKYALKDFTFENINVKDEKRAFNDTTIENTVVKNVVINGEKLKDTKKK